MGQDGDALLSPRRATKKCIEFIASEERDDHGWFHRISRVDERSSSKGTAHNDAFMSVIVRLHNHG